MSKLDYLKSKNTSVLIYGVPGSGKTSAISYLKGKTLIYDIDHGTSVLADSEADIDVVRFDIDLKVKETFPANIFPVGMKLSETITKLEKENKYKNIVVDSVSELERRMLSIYGKIDGRNGVKDGVPCQGDYQKVQFKLLDIIRMFRNLDSNLILICWEVLKEYIDPSGNKFNQSTPMINDKVRENVCGLMDIITRLEIVQDEKNTTRRVFNLTLSHKAIARDRVSKRTFCEINELI